MPKIKTRKAVSKRFKVTSSKKVMRRKSRQNHYNAKKSPDKIRDIRKPQSVQGKPAKNIIRDIN